MKIDKITQKLNYKEADDNLTAAELQEESWKKQEKTEELARRDIENWTKSHKTGKMH